LSTQKLRRKKNEKENSSFGKRKKKLRFDKTEKTKEKTRDFFFARKGHELCCSRLRRADCFGARSDRGHDYADGDSDARAGEPVRRG
jgi:hypothetical protein